MRLFIGAVYLVLTVAVFATEITPRDNPVYDYHRRVGIPKARKIQNFEANKIVGGHVNDVTETPYLVCLLDLHLFCFFFCHV